MELNSIIEALLFSANGALSCNAIADAIRNTVKDSEDESLQEFAKVKAKEVEVGIKELIILYQDQGRAFTLTERPSGWRICAHPEFAIWSRALFPAQKPARLSPPALETLAIVAYRQPITKSHMEAVRGVAVDGVLQKLMDKNLIRIAGRADLPGRPLLYETTDLFLEHFGIRSIDDLPNSSELRQVPLPDPEAQTEDGQPVEQQLAMSAISVADPSMAAPRNKADLGDSHLSEDESGEATTAADSSDDPPAENPQSEQAEEQADVSVDEQTEVPTEEQGDATEEPVGDSVEGQVDDGPNIAEGTASPEEPVETVSAVEEWPSEQPRVESEAGASSEPDQSQADDSDFSGEEEE